MVDDSTAQEVYKKVLYMPKRMSSWFVAVALVFGLVSASHGQTREDSPKIAPTHADVPYGEHARQIYDIYLAESQMPTPVVFFIHGGGWNALDKSRIHGMLDVERLLQAGISVVAINYRYASQANKEGVKPPVKACLHDAARALQTIRSKAEEYHIDPVRIGACGGSAGACTSLWLAMHDDLADPQAKDPIARQSTRLFCAAVAGAQTTLDPVLMREWMPNSTYGGHAFGIASSGKTAADKAKSYQLFYDQRKAHLDEIREYSPISHASSDDPPMYLTYTDKTVYIKGTDSPDPTHSVGFGKMLKEKFPDRDDVIVTYPAEPAGQSLSLTDYFLKQLRQ